MSLVTARPGTIEHLCQSTFYRLVNSPSDSDRPRLAHENNLANDIRNHFQRKFLRDTFGDEDFDPESLSPEQERQLREYLDSVPRSEIAATSRRIAAELNAAYSDADEGDKSAIAKKYLAAKRIATQYSAPQTS